MDKIKVFVVDDDEDWICSIQTFLRLEEDIEVVQTAYSREAALEYAVCIEYDIVLMDIDFRSESYDGLTLAAEILELKPSKIIMLTSSDDEDTILSSYNVGAVEFLRKSEYSALPHLIRSTSMRMLPVETLVHHFLKLKRESFTRDLTPAEKEIFDLKSMGYTQTEIMEKLNKSERTLKNQVGMLLKKLNSKNFKEVLEKMKSYGIRNIKSKN